MTREVFVETGAALAYDKTAAAWSFDLDLWGRCAQARSEDDALARFAADFGPGCVVEKIHGDEQAFLRDLEPLRDDELEATLAVLQTQRHRAIALFRSVPWHVLDRDDPSRELPSFARWRTVRQMLWHITDTESRYYLPSIGVPARPRAADLLTELAASAAHVQDALRAMPRDAVARHHGEVWTSTKVARRLAWHERGELDAIDDLLTRWAD